MPVASVAFDVFATQSVSVKPYILTIRRYQFNLHQTLRRLIPVKTVFSSGRLLEQALTFGLADMDAEAGTQDCFQLFAI